jgi:hypothetical protein
MTGVLRWEDPPPSRTGRPGPKSRPSLYEFVAAQLRANPQRWAVVFEGGDKSATSLANQFRRGRTGAFLPIGAFEIASRMNDGTGRIYARYVGEPS